MPLPNLDRSVGMICSTCAGDQFEHDPENLDAPIRCAGCDRIYTREQLIAENGEMIESALDDIKADVMDHASKTFRDAFRGSKYIKVR